MLFGGDHGCVHTALHSRSLFHPLPFLNCLFLLFVLLRPPCTLGKQPATIAAEVLQFICCIAARHHHKRWVMTFVVRSFSVSLKNKKKIYSASRSLSWRLVQWLLLDFKLWSHIACDGWFIGCLDGMRVERSDIKRTMAEAIIIYFWQTKNENKQLPDHPLLCRSVMYSFHFTSFNCSFHFFSSRVFFSCLLLFFLLFILFI